MEEYYHEVSELHRGARERGESAFGIKKRRLEDGTELIEMNMQYCRSVASLCFIFTISMLHTVRLQQALSFVSVNPSSLALLAGTSSNPPKCYSVRYPEGTSCVLETSNAMSRNRDCTLLSQILQNQSKHAEDSGGFGKVGVNECTSRIPACLEKLGNTQAMQFCSSRR